MNLVQFKRIVNDTDGSVPDMPAYHLKFDDGFEAKVTPEFLRDNCPCASCKGEEVLLHKYIPEHQEVSAEGYKLKSAQTIGNYAIQLHWNDGHNNGIYTWSYLRKICTNLSQGVIDL